MVIHWNINFSIVYDHSPPWCCWDHDFVAANWMTSTVPTQEEDACFFLVQGLGQVSGQCITI